MKDLRTLKEFERSRLGEISFSKSIKNPIEGKAATDPRG